ncbi:uncharacterized protein LOC128668466 [Microplitis demolitor]|uniref:uncharacterized protein LOC128668466 n=1 Tax=Microplitis demolitor TaxID=69319 RepID=UPI00235B6E94|nr:uncharacterized protein LOC128668466 [Microplitis demolitor]
MWSEVQGRGPVVTLTALELRNGRARSLVDTGADINVIRKDALAPRTIIDTWDSVSIKGITTIYHNTIVADSEPVNPIPLENTKGEPFDTPLVTMFRSEDEPSVFFLKARTRTVIPINLPKTDLKTVFLPRIETRENIFIGNAWVTNNDSTCYVYAINAYEDDIELVVPPQEIIPFECDGSSEDFFDDSEDSNIPEDGQDRFERICASLRLDHLNILEREHVHELIREFPMLFHLPGDDLPATTMMTHSIPTTGEIPISVRQYRFPPVHKEEIARQVNKLLNDGVISESVFPYNSPLWIVPKKPDSKGNKRWRMVIDFTQFNEKTIGDAYPLPNIVEILDRLGGAKYFSVFDLASGFHEIKMNPKDQQKTAFSTPNGHFKYNRMPFGLKNAPATFQRLMDRVLLGLQDVELFFYLDDVVIFASSLEEHGICDRRLFNRLEQANLVLQSDKCEFLNLEVAYLGHIIGNGGVRPDPKKTEAIEKFPKPKTVTNIRHFLGLAGYYRRFIENFSGRVKPLTELLKKDNPFNWTSAQQESFDDLRKALCTSPVLQYPDFSQPFILTTDASDLAIGAVLSQGKIGRLNVNADALSRNPVVLPMVPTGKSETAARQSSSITKHLERLRSSAVKAAEANASTIGERVRLRKLASNPSLAQPPLIRRTKTIAEIPIPPTENPSRRWANLPPIDEIHSSTNSDEEVHEDEEVQQPQQIRRQSIANTVPCELFDPGIKNHESKISLHTTNENLTYFRDNYLHFISADCELTTITSRLLIETDKIDPQDLKLKKPKINQVLITSHGKHKILSAVLKRNHFDSFSIQELKDVLKIVKNVLNHYNIKTLRISKPGDMLEGLSQSLVTDVLKECLNDCECSLTICHGSVTIPDEDVRKDIVAEYHESLTGGHKGITKTYRRIRERFYLPNMRDDITEFIRTCRSCQEQKLVRIKTKEPMIITDTPAEPFDKISIDTVGPLPQTPSGNMHILTVQDNLTKYCVAVPIPNIKAETIADALARRVIIQFGSPRVILSDQGRSFVDWDKLVPFAMFSYNIAVHESTNFTHFGLIYGKRARIPSSFPPPDKIETYGTYLYDLVNRMDDMRHFAASNLIKSKHRSKRYYDAHLNPSTLNVGDQVYAIKEPRKGKFDSHYKGPYVIAELLDNNTAIIEDEKGKRSLKHIDKLKICNTRDSTNSNTDTQSD